LNQSVLYTHIKTSMDVEVSYQEHLVCRESTCAICVENASNAQLDCGHDQFCMRCVDKWFQNSTTCPLCRAHISRVCTSDGLYKRLGVTDVEEVVLEIILLVERYVEEEHQPRYIETIYPIVKKYPPKKLLRLFNMYKGQIELGIQENSLPKLLEKYYSCKKTIDYWITLL
jgi:hypothetical protein